jgi:hypothetical protein
MNHPAIYQPGPYPAPVHNPGQLRDWWGQQSTARKVAYVGGGALAVTSVVLGVRWLMKPDPFTKVSDQCNDFALGDRQEINDAIVPLVRSAASDGPVDPFAVTTEFIRRYASHCNSYPAKTRNPGEAKLYVESFAQVLRVMEELQLVSHEQRGYFLEMVSVWGKSQGLGPADLPTEPPPTASEGQ